MFSVSLKNYTNPVVAGGHGFYGWVLCQTSQVLGGPSSLSLVNIIRLDQPTLGALAAVYGTLSSVGIELEKMKI